MILYYRSKPDQKFIEQQHVAKRHDFIVRGGKTYLKVSVLFLVIQHSNMEAALYGIEHLLVVMNDERVLRHII